ncbi:MAG: ribonuclease P protein component [Chloroflexi bacterium]|nr:ribonuclease P protein component [Chloroflexota bacterium]
MQRRQRLTQSRRFGQIHREGISAANRFLVIRALPNDLEWSRFGFVVSKRIGNAVTRNLVKRRLRESVRQIRVKGGWDAVFIARRGAASAEYRQLQRAADNLLRRTNLADTDPSTT